MDESLILLFNLIAVCKAVFKSDFKAVFKAVFKSVCKLQTKDRIVERDHLSFVSQIFPSRKLYDGGNSLISFGSKWGRRRKCVDIYT